MVRGYRRDGGGFGRPLELSREAGDVLTTVLPPELEVPLATGPFDEGTLARALTEFHELHRDVYGYAFPDEAVELIHANVSAVGPAPPPAPPPTHPVQHSQAIIRASAQRAPQSIARRAASCGPGMVCAPQAARTS